MSEKITADMIRQALKDRYCLPEWSLGFEVGNSTGADCRRYADAVAINTYPSKGFEVRGFEIKVSKSDLKSELENGKKSDEVARFCDHWFLVTPKGLTDSFTLPPTWGVMEYIDGKLRQKKRAERLSKIEPTAGFLCAMLRGRERLVLEGATQITKREEERIHNNALWMNGNATRELEALCKKLSEIKDKTGISLDSWTPSAAIIKRLQAANNLDKIADNIWKVGYNAKTLSRYIDEIQKAVGEMKGE